MIALDCRREPVEQCPTRQPAFFRFYEITDPTITDLSSAFASKPVVIILTLSRQQEFTNTQLSYIEFLGLVNYKCALIRLSSTLPSLINRIILTGAYPVAVRETFCSGVHLDCDWSRVGTGHYGMGQVAPNRARASGRHQAHLFGWRAAQRHDLAAAAVGSVADNRNCRGNRSILWLSKLDV